MKIIIWKEVLEGNLKLYFYFDFFGYISYGKEVIIFVKFYVVIGKLNINI